MMAEKKSKPIGVLLKEKGLITEKHIEFALQEQKITKEIVGQVLERLGFITENDIVHVLSERENIPIINIDKQLPNESLLRRFNKIQCLKNVFLPIRTGDNHVDIAVNDVADQKISQLVARNIGLAPRLFLAEKTKIMDAVNQFYYFLENPIEKAIASEVRLISNDTEMARGMDTLINHILHLAVKMRATDIHIRPMEKSLNIGLRVDGVMQSVATFPAQVNRLISSIKMKADMDIAEQRVPQDGHFSATILNNSYDFRASTVIAPYGENMVLRVLPVGRAFMSLEELGFLKEDIELLRTMFNEPFGIILLTGPTGSGKSTTLYAGIKNLNLLEKNVITVEDPIEFVMPLLRQTQVNAKAGYNFSNAIRHFLRHDPDVILVGEIRDSETAVTAISASSTGHLVLSTLHTNSAIGAIPRLRDMGIRPFLIADSLVGVVSQRLVRQICPECKVEYEAQNWEKRYLKSSDIRVLYKGKGCDLCNGSGYFGRTLVYELLTIDNELSQLIDQKSEVSDIRRKAKEKGFRDIFHITVTKVKQGITTVEESMRVLGDLRQQNISDTSL
ncbi:MAG: Flp pilus assembly complex ATPase component [Desulfobacteraceae bacterium]|nr:Flp pilus assembly complex ATPase component [Desulfobacteraceae bacterium]